MNIKKNLFICFLLNFHWIHPNELNEKGKSEVNQFVISNSFKKNASKNDIKEEIGEVMKSALHSCADFAKMIGEIQIEISKIQTHLFSDVENLIDNSKNFKNASKNQLKQCHGSLQKITAEFSCQLAKLKEIKKEIDLDACLKLS